MICFDLDGVVAKYDWSGYDFASNKGPKFLQDGYFYEREPDENALGLLRLCVKMCPNDTYITTGVPAHKNRNKMVIDKMRWIDERVPEFDLGTHFIAPTGKKMSFIEWIRGSAITNRDILIDDWNVNLYSWMVRGGTAIKFLNGLNSKESWPGFYLDGTLPPEKLFADLMKIVHEKGV